MGDWFERNRGFVLVMLTNLALVGGLFFWLRRPVSSPLEIVQPDLAPSPVPTATCTPSPMRIYVTGAVLHPDVYRLMPGSIVKDAVEAAGGAAVDADLIRINLAQELHDQQQIYVPCIDEVDALPLVTGSEPNSSAAGVASDGKININSASAEELDILPGIGPAFAQRIVDFRQANGPFNTIEEITLVSGVGNATFEKIKDRITVGD